MATYEHNALMQYIDEKGNIHINYPATKAENVMMGNSDAQTEITARAKTSDVLYTLEEISACSDLTGKITGATALKDVNDKIKNFKLLYDEIQIPNGEQLTIGGFINNRGYLIIDVHSSEGVSMYITSAGYGLNMHLNHIAGEKKLTLISSTPNSITVRSSKVSSLIIFELGIWY